MSRRLEALVKDIKACRICRDCPQGTRLPHEPRPVLRVSAAARIGVFGQAPGTRVHASGIPFTDPSGDRLRAWLGVTAEEFYDVNRIAIVPMGFCFPGLDSKGGDLPPRPECAPVWREKVMQELKSLELALLVGGHAQAWHLSEIKGQTLTETVAAWRRINRKSRPPQLWPLPHPSWRNNRWLADNPWFDEELVPALRRRVRAILTKT